jgi:predicted metal-dependent hydrolase
MLFPLAADPVPKAHHLDLGTERVVLDISRSPRARRYTLYLRRDGSVRLALPRRGSLADGLKFAQSKSAWIARQLHKIRARPVLPSSWKDGSQVYVFGEPAALRTQGVAGAAFAELGPLRFPIKDPAEDLRPLTEARLFALAKRELPPRVLELAERHKLGVRTITVRNQSSRWGSCSTRGTISLNWRLIQAPSFVRDYIILHELMHLKEMNHSPRYWKLVENACPDYREAERWLKLHAARLGM